MEKSLYEFNKSKIKRLKKIIELSNFKPFVDYNCTDIDYFKSIENIVIDDKSVVYNPSELFFKKGYKGEIYLLSINDTFYIIKKIHYDKKFGNNFDNIARKENIELFIMRLLSYFVINHICYHFVLPITVIRGDDYSTITYNHKRYFDKSLYIHTEYINYGDLEDLIKSRRYNSTFYRIIFFQIIHTLAIIYEYFPRFKHNDIHPGNILIEKVNVHQKFIKYVFKNNTYFIPNIGFIVKIWDFGISTVSDIIENTRYIKSNSYYNKYVDLFFFFNNIYTKIKDKETLKFIKSVLYKNKFKRDKRNRLAEDIEYTTPSKLLENNYFKYFKKNNLNLNFLFKN